MADDHPQHKHEKGDIIIKDHDGTFKILRDGKFVPLDEVEEAAHIAEHEKDHGPKRAIEDKEKSAPQFQPKPKEEKPTPKPEQKKDEGVRGLADKDLSMKAEEIIKKSGLTFASGEARNRVNNALVAHLKGVRKPFETKQNLMKSPAEGGAGLDPDEAERLMSAAGWWSTS